MIVAETHRERSVTDKSLKKSIVQLKMALERALSDIDTTEVARACAYLSSEEGGLMTGATINFDQSMWGGMKTARIQRRG